MTIGSILNSAASGIQVAQLGLTTVSENIANVNTTGYVRKVIDPTSLATQGAGSGVSSAGVTLAANQYLQNTSLGAAGQASASSVISSFLSQAQALFGDPTSATSYFNSLSQVFSNFSTAANDPTSAAAQTQAINGVSQFLGQSQTIASSLSSLTQQADSQIGTDVGQANQLLSQISQLNTSISQTAGQGGDITDAQNSQNQLLSQLSSLLDVKASTNANGTLTVTSSTGAPLVGSGGAASLSYQPATDGAGVLGLTTPGGSTASDFTPASGEIQGLLSLRGTQIPAITSQLSQFVSQTANAINAASNASSAVPAPSQLTGSNIGIDLPTAIGDFSGTSNIAIVNSSGQLQQQVAVDFSADTISVNGGAATGFTPSSFLSSLNSALGSSGSASFSNGALSISATASGTGVAITDDPTTPSSNGGEGFSQYFGLNNLVNSTGFPNANSGLQLSDASGFTGSITLQVSDPSGARIQDITVTAPTGGTVQNLLSALNSPSTGVGLYGSFSLSSQGALTYTPANPSGGGLSVVSDNTQWGTGGASISQLFNLGGAQQASLLNSFSINPAIQSNSGNLPLAQLDLSAATSGGAVLSTGDGSGGLALAKAGSATVNFAAAGGIAATSTTLTNYAAQFSGQIAQNASAAAQASTAATAVQTEATANLQSTSGVNLDQELIKLTTYQQAYSASARLLQATTDIFNALVAVIQ